MSRINRQNLGLGGKCCDVLEDGADIAIWLGGLGGCWWRWSKPIIAFSSEWEVIPVGRGVPGRARAARLFLISSPLDYCTSSDQHSIKKPNAKEKRTLDPKTSDADSTESESSLFSTGLVLRCRLVGCSFDGVCNLQWDYMSRHAEITIKGSIDR